jgi:hypothetical protein
MSTNKIEKMNSARRLLRILVRAQGCTPNSAVAIVCYQAAGLSNSGLNDHQEITLGLEVIAKIRRLLDDVECQVLTLSAANRYADCFARLRAYIHPSYGAAAWSTVMSQVYSEGTLTILELMAELLPIDSEEVVGEDIAQILKEINSLQNAIESSSLPPFHAHYSKIILGSLKRALVDYAFLGNEAFKSAARETLGLKAEMEANASSLKTEATTCSREQSELIARVQNAVERVVTMAKGIYYIAGAAKVLSKGFEKLQLFVH